MRIPHRGVYVLGALALAGMAGPLHAQPITLSPSPTSTVNASANDYVDGTVNQTASNNVTSLPYTQTTTATATDATASSVAATLSNASLGFTFTQSTSSDAAHG